MCNYNATVGTSRFLEAILKVNNAYVMQRFCSGVGWRQGFSAALYLAASRARQLTQCDHNTVDLSNLHRQITDRTSTIGLSKVSSAQPSIHESTRD